jgi:hypothetical protein
MMHKMVNGEAVELTAEEIAERLAEEAAWEAKASDRALQKLRVDRDVLLAQTDINVIADRWAAMSAETQTAWATYRQALRDLPASTSDPFNPVWPIKPEVVML